eukprot:1146510-Pelagomonas_calceolata.AAC.8
MQGNHQTTIRPGTLHASKGVPCTGWAAPPPNSGGMQLANLGSWASKFLHPFQPRPFRLLEQLQSAPTRSARFVFVLGPGPGGGLAGDFAVQLQTIPTCRCANYVDN